MTSEKRSVEERDQRVLDLYDRVLEIEQRLIPTGLHVFGLPSTKAELTDMLCMVAAFDRPEQGIRALPDLVASGLGLEEYAILVKESSTSESRMREREQVETTVHESVLCFLETGENGTEAASTLLREKASVSLDESAKVFSLLGEIRSLLQSNFEIEGLLRGLRGEYIEPGPGADIIQNPSILPTGRNTHAINPNMVPSMAALRRAEPLAQSLIARFLKETGRYPESIAMVLWGIDNIKTEGESVAQALWLLGVSPRRDSLNRATDVEVIPLERLGRPRVDVVMTVSGIFRDLFGTTMTLLDRAVRAVAVLDEPGEWNYVSRHVREQMAETGCSFDEAVVRVFSNSAGNYGTNVNFMVLDSVWEDAAELGDLFVTRKCFAYGKDSRGRSFEGAESKRLLERALARVEASYQSLDSAEVGLTDVDHYFEYLGGVSKAVERHAGSRPRIYVADSLSPSAKVRTLEETVRLETRTKVLNPKWYEGMLAHGFSGVAEIEHQVTNTFGWSATADAVDDWIYDQVAETYILDEQMLERLRSLNPHSTRVM
ncbi:MAG TPA: cobaltochelatase subunit CobN, partial [Blastocatellia bacterium]|nr:cobaltochelatase subunit CobN [Blastocatellia bacterium]